MARALGWVVALVLPSLVPRSRRGEGRGERERDAWISARRFLDMGMGPGTAGGNGRKKVV